MIAKTFAVELQVGSHAVFCHQYGWEFLDTLHLRYGTRYVPSYLMASGFVCPLPAS